MSREDVVKVKTKNGAALAFSHGRCSLLLAAGETADKWLDGSPITRGEFEDVLAPHAEVEIVESPSRSASGPRAAKAKD
jgi:hypothetical protein